MIELVEIDFLADFELLLHPFLYLPCPSQNARKSVCWPVLATVSGEDIEPFFFSVSLTKVSKKTKEHKNALMNEVCGIDQFICLILTS
jgi:hypothetical protein